MYTLLHGIHYHAVLDGYLYLSEMCFTLFHKMYDLFECYSYAENRCITFNFTLF